MTACITQHSLRQDSGTELIPSKCKTPAALIGDAMAKKVTIFTQPG